MANKLSFNILQIIEETKDIGDRYINPTLNSFKGLEEEFNHYDPNSKTYYQVTFEESEDYVWFYLNFGKPNPRDDYLTNVENGTKRSNDRHIKEAELTMQCFCFYDLNSELFYISNSKKKSILISILGEKLNRNFIFKEIKKTKEEFIEILSRVSEISFTEVKDLFNNDSKKRQALIDLTGVDAPEKFTISANYHKNSQIIEFIKNLFSEKQKHSLSDLVIKGIDENDFAVVFNNETFNRSVEVLCDKDENGKFLEEEAKKALLKEIRK
ncbi:hypothetical protein AQ14_227 [Francisella tularensis subsp. novicida D9876]|uniref:hypothetical protein n=1 Tax=Francisella tularensis TaxID=263 RepID=UPI000311FFC7|nr:hypothetical protein [Francisella tularensis]AJI72440.1 hypothetical protein AQ14_227 [Francisella tularensis subsp. novicida D9876]